ncbi:hypothetical protein BASA50_000677 [Batrachochytrium salamandrivorans]|uniref:Tudor domain-containing protein n=1 Tax=Batrachochytrium salamandrivorans TaxID=1357716 RepID=A0ABQ8ET97_9FUNG|nr:hypothetical protein BASA62_004902 [Batrachochytrium salamandrivorans]KAH6573163.1 hypothetical protein BASA60_006177 [Batrachochytrium salamandrivorans]KAH6579625.1 hypothetical protein BASA61_010141 [Batrachochytrium salamandrivorans]KAH6586212.1 hypothetical protein BASA50_000677 [Batrachochytrium salamandrivorans]KAH9254976.1 hypothetical protein BASA81_007044 [Batrachochytrium salamandrivorans]
MSGASNAAVSGTNSAVAQELENYQFQLEQVNEALQRDPENTELLKLSGDLAEVVLLFQQQANVASTAAVSGTNSAGTLSTTTLDPTTGKEIASAPTTTVKRHVPSWAQRSSSSKAQKQTNEAGSNDSVSVWEAGKIVLAQWTDGQFYEATIVGPHKSFNSPTSAHILDIIFTGFETVEQISVDALKEPPVPAGASAAASNGSPATSIAASGDPASSSTKKAGLPSSDTASADTSRQFKKKKTKKDGPGKLESEQLQKQSAWLKFAGKGEGHSNNGGAKSSKKVSAASTPAASSKPASWQQAGFKRKSMFSTPDDPNARVGVIGSGKPMTQFQSRGRHVFSKDD